MLEVREDLDTEGYGPYAKQFNRLKSQAAAKVASGGPDGTGQPLQHQGRGCRCRRVPHKLWPRLGVYCGKDGDALIILLGGRTKKRQQRDIEIARSLWQDYKRRK